MMIVDVMVRRSDEKVGMEGRGGWKRLMRTENERTSGEKSKFRKGEVQVKRRGVKLFFE